VPIVKLVFWHNSFDNLAIAQISTVVQFLSVGLFPSISGILILFFFLITGRAKLIVAIMVTSVTANALLDYILLKIMGLGGIALCSSLVGSLRLIVFIILLGMAVGKLNLSALSVPLLKTATASILTGVSIKFLSGVVSGLPVSSGTYGGMVGTAALLMLGGLLYLGVSLVLRNEQLLSMTSFFGRCKEA
jgi:putative peptidoglycan lipid II flippase